MDSDNRYTVLVKDSDDWRPSAKNFTVKKISYPIFSFNPIKYFGYAKMLNGLKPDLVHMTLAPMWSPGLKSPYVLFAHDLTMLKHTRAGRYPILLHKLRMAGYRFMLKKSFKNASWIHTPTEYVLEDVSKHYLFTNRKISYTHEASDPPLNTEAIAPKLRPKNFIMYTGTTFPHKNIDRLVLAFGELKEQNQDLKLVLVGKMEWHRKKLQDWASRLPYFEDIVFTGFIPDEELKWYYENARVYVFPSLSEGFGLPGLEAMVHGCPVASSSATCLPEVNGGAAVYFNPLDTQDMASAINKVLADPKFAAKLVKKGYENTKRFSWSKMAKETLEIYQKILSDNE